MTVPRTSALVCRQRGGDRDLRSYSGPDFAQEHAQGQAVLLGWQGVHRSGGERDTARPVAGAGEHQSGVEFEVRREAGRARGEFGEGLVVGVGCGFLGSDRELVSTTRPSVPSPRWYWLCRLLLCDCRRAR